MGPKSETSGELLRSLRALLGIKQIALQQGQLAEQLSYAVASLLTEIVARGECRASDLAHRRVVDVSVVSRQVAQLEHAGLIARHPDPDDRRVSLLWATDEGKRTVHELEQRKAQWLGAALQDWDDSQVRELAHLLTAAMRDVRRYSCPASEELPGAELMPGESAAVRTDVPEGNAECGRSGGPIGADVPASTGGNASSFG